ncbi:hypothetical protein [Kitasatospora sp. NPDC059327]|uniref:hypothetical protein n=1 Tax=Kitasatospora sp. NPDC059327 TaxID=3346803 RepID=UPI0036B0C4F9
MSEPVEGTEPQARPGGKGLRDGLRGRRWLRGRPARWAAAGAAAVVVIGGGAAAVAVQHEGEGHGKHAMAAEDGHQGHGGGDGEGRGHRGPSGRDGEGRGHQGQGGHKDGREGEGREDGHGGQAAPAPLPSVEAADAAAKAVAGVAGGKVESLTTVAEQGGGRAWRAVVVGPDGVRHAVTVDGATGTITGNTVLGG